MISVIILARNTRDLLTLCLRSVSETFALLAIPAPSAEFILIDDFSDANREILSLYEQFRADCPYPTRIVRFKKHVHYTFGLAAGLSLARGRNILFLSHDMILAPACLSTLLDVASLSPNIGIVRPTSQHMDGSPPAIMWRPPLAMRSTEDVRAFSRYVANHHGNRYYEDQVFIGDAMLIKRSLLDTIGYPDTRFRGFFGDIDLGLRAQLAGFKTVTAVGAWLHHEGSGFTKDSVRAGTATDSDIHTRNLADTQAAYTLFREKWSPNLPEKFTHLDDIDFPSLRALPRTQMTPVPPLTLSSEIVDIS
jgi:GT2 family glycosyltransferase